MEKIIFSNEVIYDGNVQIIGSNLIRITFTNSKPAKKVLTDGFKLLNEHNLFVQRDCSDYTTVYRMPETDPLIVEFSNDGSVWVEPIPPEPEPEPEPYVPTFEEVRSEKIAELSSICNQIITGGVVVNDESFSYITEDQINIKELFDTVTVTGLPISYHANGKSCRDFSAQEIVNIYIQLMTQKFASETYFNQTKHYLLSLEENEANRELISTYAYGTELTGEYLENYNNCMQTLQNQIEVIIGKLSEE